jgi:hypothetical protein
MVLLALMLSANSAFTPRISRLSNQRNAVNMAGFEKSANADEHLDEKERVESLWRESLLSAQKARQDVEQAALKVAAEASAEQRFAEAEFTAFQCEKKEAKVLAAAEKAEAMARQESDIIEALALAEKTEREAIEARHRADAEHARKRKAEIEAEAAEELARHEMDVALEKEGELAAQMMLDAHRKLLEAREIATVAAAEEAERAAAEARAEVEELIQARIQEEERRHDMDTIRKYAREKAQAKLKESSE